VPSDELGGVTGVYTATATFTPSAAFAGCYAPRDFTLDIHVVPDTAALDELAEDKADPLVVLLHADNYTAAAIAAVQTALASANTVRADTGYTYTQADVDGAVAALNAALAALVHDHPVISQRPSGGIVDTGEDASFEFKGYFGDVSSFKFGGKSYSLQVAGGAGGAGAGGAAGAGASLEILDGTTRVGTITEGSAVVTLNASFCDDLANGTYAVELGFADTYTLKGGETFNAQGIGTSELVVSRDDASTEPTDPGDGDGTGDGSGDGDGTGGGTPQLGDSLQPILLAILLTCIGILFLVIWRGTRRYKTHRR
jgi:hypothetical protein